jgi:hypothetical protein
VGPATVTRDTDSPKTDGRGAPVNHVDFHGNPLGGALGKFAQAGLRLDGYDLAHVGRVVGEVQAVPGADLDHASLQARQQRTAVLARAALLAGAGDVRIHTGEDRVIGCARHQLTPGSRRSTACRSADRNRANDGRFAPVFMWSCRNICRCLSPRLRLL